MRLAPEREFGADGFGAAGLEPDPEPPLAGWRASWDWRKSTADLDALAAADAAAPEPIVPEELELELLRHEAEVRALLPKIVAFLATSYVEDPDGDFRFAYELRHLDWALLGAGATPDLFVVLRERSTRDIVGFAAAAPTTLLIDGDPRPSAFIDFVCVRKRWRSHRLLPTSVCDNGAPLRRVGCAASPRRLARR